MFGPPDIAKLKHEQGFKGLLKALTHRRVETRLEAVQACGQLRASSLVQPLIGTLEDREARVRQEAAKVLGELGDRRAFEPLVALLADDADGGVRYRVAEALGRLRDERALKPLTTAALEDRDADVAQAAREALVGVGGQGMLKALKRRQGRADELVDRLVDVGDVAGLVRVALEEPEVFIQPAAREHLPAVKAERALLGIGAAAVQPLVEALERRSPAARARAVRLLGRLGEASTVQPLAALLRDSDVGVRANAALALGAIGGEQAEPALVGALRDHDYRVREEAVDALAALQALEPLLLALADRYLGVRLRAARALGALGDRRAVRALVAALADQGRAERDDPYGDGRAEIFPVREAAAAALSHIGGEEAERALAQYRGATNR